MSSSVTKDLRRRAGCPDLDPDWPNILGEPRGPTLCVSYPNCECGREDEQARAREVRYQQIMSEWGVGRLAPRRGRG